jgi:hypothetical protein
MADHLEEHLRSALALRATELPSDVAARLRQIDYHPRSSRVRPLLLLVSSAGVAGSVAVVLAIAGLGTGAQRAFAGWAPVPTTPSSGQVAAAQAACVTRLSSSTEIGASIQPGGWHAVLTDTRGSFTTVLYEAAEGRAEASCFAGPSPYEWSMSMSINPKASVVPAGHVSVTSLGSNTTPRSLGEQHFMRVVGRTGPGVGGVTLALSDGTHVTASTAGGWFLAWWPGTRPAVAAEIATAAGTNTQQLG